MVKISSMKKEYPVIEIPADGKPKWYGGARCMCFVYSRFNGNFILKGFINEVEKNLKENYRHYFYYISMWNGGKSRGHWNFWKDDILIIEPDKSKKRMIHKKYRITKYNRENYEYTKELEFEFKRLPKRWIPEFDLF